MVPRTITSAFCNFGCSLFYCAENAGCLLAASRHVCPACAAGHPVCAFKPQAAFKFRPHCGIIMARGRSEEHTSELQSLMRISYGVFCLKKKTHKKTKAIEHN